MKNATEIYELVGENFKKIRTDIIGTSQEKMADDNDISRSFISKLESKKVDMGISISTLFYLAQKYNIDIRDFFKGYEKFLKEEKR